MLCVNREYFFKLILFLFGAAFIISCECVTNIETPRLETPSQFSHILYVNANSGFDQLKMNTGSEGFILNSYYSEDNFNYKDMLPGTQNFYITTKSDSVLFNGLTDLQKGLPYTFIAYGNHSRVQGIILNDSIENYTPNNCYFRCINLGNETPYIMFRLTSSDPKWQIKPFRTISPFTPTYSGNYNIDILDATTDSLLLSLRNRVFAPGKAYSIILRGDFKGIGMQKMDIQIVESDYMLLKNK